MPYLQRLRLQEAWDVAKGEDGDVVIAVIDVQMDWRHRELAANIWTNPGEIPDNGVDDDGNGFVDDVRGWSFWNESSDTGTNAQGARMVQLWRQLPELLRTTVSGLPGAAGTPPSCC